MSSKVGANFEQCKDEIYTLEKTSWQVLNEMMPPPPQEDGDNVRNECTRACQRSPKPISRGLLWREAVVVIILGDEAPAPGSKLHMCSVRMKPELYLHVSWQGKLTAN